MNRLLVLTGRIVVHRDTGETGKVLETDITNKVPRYKVAFKGYKTFSWQSLATIRLAAKWEIVKHNS